MGTALVVYEDQKAWEAAHNLLHKKAETRSRGLRLFPKRFVIVFVASLLVTILVEYTTTGFLEFQLVPLSFGEAALGIAGAILMLGIIFYPKDVQQCLFDANIRELKFDCPTCNQTISLAQNWKCGHCHERHTGMFDTHLMEGCKNPDCYVPGDVAKHRAQAAVQCSECNDHIVLNPLLYNQLGSHKADLKYPGVARFLADNDQPVLGGKPPDELPNVGDLGSVIKQAIDRTI